MRPEQLESCIPMADGDACNIDGVGDGICDQQVCIVARCGDGYQRGDEACDGNDIPADVTCQSCGFYMQGAVACNDACGIDDSMCLGSCGDGQVDPEHEVCEPTIDPVLTCVDFGYGAGVLGCNMCAPGLEECRRFGWDTITLPFSPESVGGTTTTTCSSSATRVSSTSTARIGRTSTSVVALR